MVQLFIGEIRMRVLLRVALGWCIGTTLLGHARGQDAALEPTSHHTEFFTAVSSGQFFYSGEHLKGPYEISVRKQSNGQEALYLNGNRLELLAEEWDLRERETQATQRGYADRRASNGLNRRRPGLVEERSGFTRSSDAHMDSAGHRGSNRRRSHRQFQKAGGPKRNWANPSGNQAGSTIALAERVSTVLEQDGIVVASSGMQLTALVSPTDKRDFCSALLNGGEDSEQTKAFLELAPVEQRESWYLLLTNFRPDQDLASWMANCIDVTAGIERKNQREVFAVKIMERTAYPLTVIGMMLGVFALGHTLKWSSVTPNADDAIRFVKLALVLIIAMSALDLTWTVITAAAGEMRELNPMAVSFIDSPWKLVVFKTTVTLAACGILLALKAHPKAQFATWWMCLICVLLTFRWVVFQSLMV